VALAKRVTPSMVRKARNEERLNPETGLEMAPLSGCEMPAEERRATVIQMVGKGLSAKAVALRLGVHYNTVRRDLARAD
jgi:DNA-binding NarL/FixJ family response regulator